MIYGVELDEKWRISGESVEGVILDLDLYGGDVEDDNGLEGGFGWVGGGFEGSVGGEDVPGSAAKLWLIWFKPPPYGQKL